jgi:hypothetical protein
MSNQWLSPLSERRYFMISGDRFGCHNLVVVAVGGGALEVEAGRLLNIL